MAPALLLDTPPLVEGKTSLHKVERHAIDLPPIHTRPDGHVLLGVLNHLAIPPTSWEGAADSEKEPRGVAKWLTAVIASPLGWIADDDVKEVVWEGASRRLAERCGRTATPSQTRTFHIPLPSSEETVEIRLHEPTITDDNLGLKTWGSSYLLAKRLSLLQLKLPRGARALELGAGTGLVGITAAKVLGVDVLVTDLPEIVGNLERNSLANAGTGVGGGRVDVAVMDWRVGADEVVDEGQKFELVIAADPLYSSEHPRLVVKMVEKWLKRGTEGRVVVELPLREGFRAEREEFRGRMVDAGLGAMEEGVESGFDDWGSGEVECWWSVWGWESGL